MLKSEQIQIKDLSIKRYDYIHKRNKTWNEVEYLYNPEKEIDSLGDEILTKIKEWRNLLSLEFILDELSNLGQAPNLLYDDNGHFAIASDGFQNVSSEEEPIDMKMSFFVPKESWKKTIREALDFYLDEN